jgi:serine/threonine-protein kinase
VDLSGRTLVGKYAIDGLIGQGAMGTVWKGAHVFTGRKVAIKVLDERFLSNVEVIQRFGREARAASAVQHEGIVEVLDLDQTEEGLPFLVMEFLEGETLSQRIERKGRLSQQETVRIGMQLLDALAAAHRQGVVHRDLKPDNIFLVPAGRRGEIVKILDFGISRKDDEAQAKLTMTGSVLGTPYYMSPEQARGETDLDHRVDIYAVGVVLYECLVGEVPFDAPNYNALLRVILDEEPVPPTRRGVLVDPRLEELVLWALVKEREQRPQTAELLLERLSAVTHDETSRTTAERGDASSADGILTAGLQARSAARPRLSAPDVGGAHSFGVAEPSAAPRVPKILFDAPLEKPVEAAPSRASPSPAAPALHAPLLPVASLDPYDTLANPSAVALELDEAALARPARNERISHAAGHRRAVSERSLAAASASSSALPGSRLPEGAHAARSVGAADPDALPLPPLAPQPAPRLASFRGAALRARWNALPESARRWISRVAAALVVFVALVWLLRWAVRPGEEQPVHRTAPPVSPATTTSGASASGEFVLVHVDGVPPNAQVLLDGVPGALLPLRVRRGTAHVLEIRAAGYEDRRIEFTAEPGLRLRANMRAAIGSAQSLR